MEFTGFPPDVFAFYVELQSNNNREWWQANKQRYLTSVREPLEALAEALEPEFGFMKIFRPYRDVRFSKDKTPYQLHASMVSQPIDGSGPAYFQLGRDGIMIGGGYWQPDSEQLERFRTLVDEKPEDLEIMLAELTRDGFPLSDGDALKTAPRGYKADHPRIDLLRLRSLTIRNELPRASWMSSREGATKVAEQFRVVKRWGEWLKANLVD